MTDTRSGPDPRVREVLGLDSVARHVFLCADQKNPRCAAREEGLQSWAYLKQRIRELALDTKRPAVLRSKVDCFRVCQKGPIAVVYPDGVWYHSVTPEVLERILQEHVILGRIVEEYCFARPSGGSPHISP
jgi:(2Fe-2S) ferredoxin